MSKSVLVLTREKKFSDDGTNNEPTNFSEESPTQYISFVKAIKGSIRAYLVNLKSPEEINKCLEEAKQFFQAANYKKSKNIFKNLLGSKHVDKSEVSLYLTAIYLLEKDILKASEHLKEVKDCYLKIVIHTHLRHLQSLRKDSPFLQVNFYGIKTESKDEQIIMNRLFESFKKTSYSKHAVDK